MRHAVTEEIKMKRRELLSLCKSFTRGMLEGRASQGQCARVSWGLHGYLSYLGLKTTMYESHVGDWNHVYLMMENGEVIDCTADQFNRGRRKNPQVYIGKPLSIHKGGKPFKR